MFRIRTPRGLIVWAKRKSLSLQNLGKSLQDENRNEFLRAKCSTKDNETFSNAFITEYLRLYALNC